MAVLRILLIEDNPADATMFVDQIQTSLGDEVHVEWKTRLGDALALLEQGEQFDQIWLDPGLPDLAQGNVGTALKTLKRHVESGELRMLSSAVAPSVASQAQQYRVEVVKKDSLTERDGEILQVIRDMFAKKSGTNSTVRVEFVREMARVETKLTKLEGALDKITYQVQENVGRITSMSQAIDRLNMVDFKLSNLEQAVNRIDALSGKIGELQSQLKQSKDSQELKLKRWDVFQIILVAAISATVTLLAPLLPKLFDQSAPAPSPPTQTP